jgi:hypothetical protein
MAAAAAATGEARTAAREWSAAGKAAGVVVASGGNTLRDVVGAAVREGGAGVAARVVVAVPAPM